MRWGLLLAALPVAAAAASSQPATSADDWFYEERVRPLLEQRCYACHSSRVSRPQGGLRLDQEAGWRRGGASGPVIAPGKPAHSRLIRAIQHDPAVPTMPPGGRLPDSEIALLVEWVKRGAPGPAARDCEPGARNQAEQHWAFRPLRPVEPPRTIQRVWGWTPVDRFILARLETEGLKPSPPTDRRTLIRRATFDLTGLPPTPAAVSAFLNDRAPGAYERLVDRLLASPRYGERWGRHWLDVVHFGDTHGYDKDMRRDHAWPHRDYVIRSLNRDKPYSRFVKEQLAGDVLFPHDPEGLIATGFIAAGPRDFVGHQELRDPLLQLLDAGGRHRAGEPGRRPVADEHVLIDQLRLRRALVGRRHQHEGFLHLHAARSAPARWRSSSGALDAHSGSGPLRLEPPDDRDWVFVVRAPR